MYPTRLLNECAAAGRVFIAGHTNPDADSVGSCLALALAMKGLGIKPAVLLERFSDKYGFLPGADFVCHDYPDALAPEVMICLDTATKARLGRAAAVLDRASSTYNIDHHYSNERYAGVNVIEPGASSASEIVYGVIKRLGAEITPDVAAALYAGIIGDTGAFRHRNVTPDTYMTAAELIRTGFDFSAVSRRTLYEHNLTEARVFGLAAGKMQLDQALKLAYSCLSKAEMDSAGASGIDLDGIPEYLLNTRGAEISALLSEREEGVINISLRSVSVNVGETAAVFSGGGHVNAAGCKIRGTMGDALAKLTGALSSRKEPL